MESNQIDKVIFKELTKKTPWPWLRDATIDWLIVSLSMGAVMHYNNLLSYLCAFFIVGNRQHALAILGHDGTHFTLFKSKQLNDLVTNLFAFWPIGLTTSGYRNLHFMHHKHANTHLDPELAHRSSKKPQWDLPSTPRTILKYTVMDLFGYSFSDYIMIVKFARPDSKMSLVALAIFHGAIISVLTISGMWPVLAIWYSALVTTFMMQFRLRTWLEHQGSDDTHRLHLNLLERVLLSPHNAWYHYEHHKWPSIPYHRLSDMRKLMPDEPVITLRDLLAFYKDCETIASGSPLKISTKDDHTHTYQPEENNTQKLAA